MRHPINCESVTLFVTDALASTVDNLLGNFVYDRFEWIDKPNGDVDLTVYTDEWQVGKFIKLANLLGLNYQLN